MTFDTEKILTPKMQNVTKRTVAHAWLSARFHFTNKFVYCVCAFFFFFFLFCFFVCLFLRKSQSVLQNPVQFQTTAPISTR